MCFQIGGISAQAAKCVKSRIVTKLIYSVLSIDKFEQRCVMFKGKLQSLRLKDHMKIICIHQSLSNSDIFEHRCLQNINKLYQHDGKCDGQQQLKYVLEVAMVSTPGGLFNKWKCVLKCCAKFPYANLPGQETDDQYSGTTPLILFHIYHLIYIFIGHVKIQLNDKICFACVNRNLLQKNPQTYTLENMQG